MACHMVGGKPFSELMLEYKPIETNFSEILIEIHTSSFKKMLFKMMSVKWQPFYLGLNVLKDG